MQSIALHKMKLIPENIDVRVYLNELKEAFGDLNKSKIIEFARKYNLDLALCDEDDFWLAVYRIVTAFDSYPSFFKKEIRKKARRELKLNMVSPYDKSEIKELDL